MGSTDRTRRVSAGVLRVIIASAHVPTGHHLGVDALAARARAGRRPGRPQRPLCPLRAAAAPLGERPPAALGARSSDTPDLVQETLLNTFRNIEGFEFRDEGAQAPVRRRCWMRSPRPDPPTTGARSAWAR